MTAERDRAAGRSAPPHPEGPPLAPPVQVRAASTARGRRTRCRSAAGYRSSSAITTRPTRPSSNVTRASPSASSAPRSGA
jgi:hypothetical protein